MKRIAPREARKQQAPSSSTSGWEPGHRGGSETGIDSGQIFDGPIQGWPAASHTQQVCKYSKEQDNVIFPQYRAKCDQLLRTNSRCCQPAEFLKQVLVFMSRLQLDSSEERAQIKDEE
ncbi:hypothetical protein chiPu_0020191 [Chiloscyllium punctatum]|uniref:Uncharacterized protein n=1 Tax=Chiloscyllium punctatum TaxID=137246 RepID=A0A401RUC5_CHIPU|nr:hypothetical protein [Chiloscyllium punctatum]